MATRYATVFGNNIEERKVAAFLPANYHVTGERHEHVIGPNLEVFIEGEDNAGWTLDDYVIPRLLSGAMGCRETDCNHYPLETPRA